MYYIYKIENLVNHKKYIGLTNHIIRRKSRHFCDLKYGRHDNHFLQKEYDIYGKNNFSFEILFQDDVDSQTISDKEKEYIKLYDSYYNGYNQNEGGNFGPSNGGTKFTKSDIFTILAVSEFTHRSGQVLADIYDTSKTTISRINKGVNHCQCYEEYHNLSYEDRYEIFYNIQKDLDIEKQIINSNKLQKTRKLTDEQALWVLVNHDYHIMTHAKLAEKIGVKSTYTLQCIWENKTYKDVNLQYSKMTDSEKQKIATLLSNK